MCERSFSNSNDPEIGDVDLCSLAINMFQILRREITFVHKDHQRQGIAQYLLHLGLDFEKLRVRFIGWNKPITLENQGNPNWCRRITIETRPLACAIMLENVCHNFFWMLIRCQDGSSGQKFEKDIGNNFNIQAEGYDGLQSEASSKANQTLLAKNGYKLLAESTRYGWKWNSNGLSVTIVRSINN